MATATLEDRLAAIEQEISALKERLDTAAPPLPSAKWEKIFGTFANSEGFDEAVQLGRDYRESLRAESDGDAR